MATYTPYDKLASGLRELRKAEGWTQEELGERIGVAGATISRWESGEHVPQKHHLHALEECYGLAFGNLVDRFVNLAARRKLYERYAALHTHGGRAQQIGVHTVELTPEGDLLVNGTTIIKAPRGDGG